MKLKRMIYYKYRLFKLFPHFFSRFGFVDGGILFAKLFFSIGKIRLNVPQTATPLVIRSDESDPIVFWEVFINECYKIDLPNDPQFIIDGGANTGLSTVYLANRFPDAKIVAVEPDQGNVAILNTNCTQYENVSVVESALWGTDGHLKISNPQNSGWGFVVEKTGEDDPNAFPATTIQHIVERFDGPQIDLLKLDIEGAERNVFTGSQMEWIQNVGCLVIELHDYEHEGCREPVMNACSSVHLDLISEHDHVCVFRSGLVEADAYSSSTHPPLSVLAGAHRPSSVI